MRQRNKYSLDHCLLCMWWLLKGPFCVVLLQRSFYYSYITRRPPPPRSWSGIRLPSRLRRLLALFISYLVHPSTPSCGMTLEREWDKGTGQRIITPLPGCYHKVMELLLHVIWQMLREGCFRLHADGMAALPVLIPSKGSLEFGIICEFFRLQSQH